MNVKKTIKTKLRVTESLPFCALLAIMDACSILFKSYKMKRIKNYVIVLMVILIPISVMPQNPSEMKESSPEERAQIQTEWMQETLELDSITTIKANAINLKYANKMEELKGSGEDRYQLFQEFKSLSNEKDTELKEVFSSEQYKSYQKKKKELRNMMQSNMQ